MRSIDFTHDPERQSWLESANDPATDFPIQNLPYAVFHTGDGQTRVGVGIGDKAAPLQVVDFATLSKRRRLAAEDRRS